MDYSQPTTQSDIVGILKRKRKVREHKACFPCRQRKVKCDSQVPCRTCVERNHADICNFNQPEKRLDNGSMHSQEANVTISKDDWDRFCSKLNSLERSLSDLKHDLRHAVGGSGLSPDADASPSSSNTRELSEPNGPKYVRAMEISEQNKVTGEVVHLGGGSIPALVMALGRNSNGNLVGGHELFTDRVLPLFGLDNESATYPFVSLWGNQGTSTRINELCKALPGDAECLESFRQYRDGAYHTYPALVGIEKFESDLLAFLMNRRANQSDANYVSPSDVMHGMSLQWVGLLFATFASGAQFSSMPKKDRELVSQVYVCCSFECLRLVNYLSNASLEVIQTMLILGNVLSNAMNAGVAWSLLGLTIRLAQSLGMHRASEITPTSHQDMVRSKTWWAVLWQDSLLSISYDRASCASTVDCALPAIVDRSRGGMAFADCMYRICKVGLDLIRNRVAPQSIEGRLSRCQDLRDDVQRAQDQATDHCRDLRSCRSIRDQGEYWALYLHASYMKSELCRPAISPSTAVFDKDHKLRKQCFEYLKNTVEAFLGLANVTTMYTRTWAVVHRALSSALLLGLLGEPARNPEVQDLLGKLIEVLIVMGHSEVSAPIARSLSALRKLCALETRTPRPGDHPWDDVKVIPDPAFIFDESQLPSNFDESSFLFPSDFSGDESPYALMDSIMWGGGRGTF